MGDGDAIVNPHPAVTGPTLPDQGELRGRFILSPPRDRGVVAEAWLASTAREGTRRVYEREIRLYFEWCDLREVDTLAARRVDIDRYRQRLNRRHSAATSAKKLSALSSFYRYGTEEFEDLVRTNPVLRIRRPKLSKDSTTAGLDLDEVRLLLAAADTAAPLDRAVTRLLFATGMRVSELCGALVRDLRTEKGQLTVAVSRKGGRVQRLLVQPKAAEALTAYLDGRSDGHLFIGSRNGPITRYEVALILAQLVKLAEIEGKNITPHSMRHTFATLALDAGADIRDVMHMMGHASIETTMRYNRARSSIERSPAHALARHVEGA